MWNSQCQYARAVRRSAVSIRTVGTMSMTVSVATSPGSSSA